MDTINVNGSIIDLWVPDQGTKIQVKPDSAIILFIQKIRVHKGREYRGGGQISSYTNTLIIDFYYFFWDNVHGKMISFGIGKASKDFGGIFSSISLEDWQDLIHNMGINIAYDSPFKKIQFSRYER